VLVCCSFGSPPFSSLVLDRVIVATMAAGIQPVVVLNKVDLAEDTLLQQVTATYTGALTAAVTSRNLLSTAYEFL